MGIAKEKRAHHMVFEYIDGGADDQITLQRSMDAYADLEFTQRAFWETNTQTSIFRAMCLGTR